MMSRGQKYVSTADGYRNGRPCRKVYLTKKGLREFYKAMF